MAPKRTAVCYSSQSAISAVPVSHRNSTRVLSKDLTHNAPTICDPLNRFQTLRLWQWHCRNLISSVPNPNPNKTICIIETSVTCVTIWLIFCQSVTLSHFGQMSAFGPFLEPLFCKTARKELFWCSKSVPFLMSPDRQTSTNIVTNGRTSEM